MRASFERSAVAALVIWDHFLAGAEAASREHTNDCYDLAPNRQLYFSQKFADANPAAVDAILTGMSTSTTGRPAEKAQSRMNLLQALAFRRPSWKSPLTKLCDVRPVVAIAHLQRIAHAFYGLGRMRKLILVSSIVRKPASSRSLRLCKPAFLFFADKLGHRRTSGPIDLIAIISRSTHCFPVHSLRPQFNH